MKVKPIPKTEIIDFDKIFKEIREFLDNLTNKSRYNHAFFALSAQSGANGVLNRLLTDKTIFLSTETKEKLFKLMDDGIPNMIAWFYELKDLALAKEKKNAPTSH